MFCWRFWQFIWIRRSRFLIGICLFTFFCCEPNYMKHTNTDCGNTKNNQWWLFSISKTVQGGLNNTIPGPINRNRKNRFRNRRFSLLYSRKTQKPRATEKIKSVEEIYFHNYCNRLSVAAASRFVFFLKKCFEKNNVSTGSLNPFWPGLAGSTWSGFVCILEILPSFTVRCPPPSQNGRPRPQSPTTEIIFDTVPISMHAFQFSPVRNNL